MAGATIIKAFLVQHDLVSNDDGVVSPMGELSSFSLTFSRKKGYYEDLAFPTYTLVSFTSKDSNGGYASLAQDQVTRIFTLIDYLKGYYSTHIPPYQIDALRSDVLSHYPNTYIELTTSAELFTYKGVTLPHWISFNDGVSGASVSVWLTDSSFRALYDECETIVITPLPNLDDFLTAPAQTPNLIASQSLTDVMSRVDAVRGDEPYTYLRFVSVNYIDPTTGAATPVSWPVILYGVANDFYDNLKLAIIDKITSESAFPVSRWRAIFPQLFERTEMVVVPFWDRYAIPNMLTQTGIYASYIAVSEVIDHVRPYVSFYDESWVNQYTYVVPFAYKCLLLGVVDGQYNDSAHAHFPAMYGDYLPLASSAIDFARMSSTTQTLIRQLETVLVLAEGTDRYTILPAWIKRVKRGNITYYAFRTNDLDVLVVPKYAIGG